MLVQARRSGFIPTSGTSGSVDGAHLIKVKCNDVSWRADILRTASTRICRPIRGSAASTGRIYIAILRLTARI